MSIVFLLCFSIYAISPLTGLLNSPLSLQNGNVEIQLYVVHFLASVFFDDNDVLPPQKDNTYGDHCLIKQKKAVFHGKEARLVKPRTTMRALPEDIHHENGFLFAASHLCLSGHRVDQKIIAFIHPANSPPAA